MIHYLVTQRGTHTLVPLLTHWAPDLRNHIRQLPYEHLTEDTQLRPGTYVFTDLERLSPVELQAAARVFDQLAESRDRVQLLNDPTRAARRYELQRRLHHAGVNRHRLYRIENRAEIRRFPVFLRRENDHAGAVSPLLPTQRELERWIGRAIIGGCPPENLLIAEFFDTADADGVYRKYGTFIIGGEVIPRHIWFGRHWEQNEAELIEDRFVKEERDFTRSIPHEAAIRKAFSLAALDYGRADYAFADGSVEVWEINTNPVPVTLPKRIQPERLAVLADGIEGIRKAFEALDTVADEGPSIRVRIGPAHLRAFRSGARSRRRRRHLMRAAALKTYVAAELMLLPVTRKVLPWVERRSLRVNGK